MHICKNDIIENTESYKELKQNNCKEISISEFDFGYFDNEKKPKNNRYKHNNYN